MGQFYHKAKGIDKTKDYYKKCFDEGIVAYYSNTPCKYNQYHHRGRAWKDGYDFEKAFQPDSPQYQTNFSKAVQGTMEFEDVFKYEDKYKRQNPVWSDRAKALFREIKINEIVNG